MDRYKKENIISEGEKLAYLNHNKLSLNDNKQLLNTKIENDVKDRLRQKTNYQAEILDRNFYKKNVLAPKLNQNSLYSGNNDKTIYHVNVFNNENLDAKLHFVDDYFKNQRKLIIEKKMNSERSATKTPRRALNA